MKHKKIILLQFCFSVFFFTTDLKTSVAQNKYLPGKLSKYEIAIDLQHFFSDGRPDKVLFKVNNIKGSQIVGAYRIGVGADYWVSTYKITHDNQNYALTGKENQKTFSMLLGYEFQKYFDKAVFYYGADLGALIAIYDDIDFPNVAETYNLLFVPFAGVKVLLSTNLSVAFEAGIKNYYAWWRSQGSGGGGNPDNRQYHSYYTSKFDLPYSLTFNFNF